MDKTFRYMGLPLWSVKNRPQIGARTVVTFPRTRYYDRAVWCIGTLVDPLEMYNPVYGFKIKSLK